MKKLRNRYDFNKKEKRLKQSLGYCKHMIDFFKKIMELYPNCWNY